MELQSNTSFEIVKYEENLTRQSLLESKMTVFKTVSKQSKQSFQIQIRCYFIWRLFIKIVALQM